MIFGGIFEKFPLLRINFCHASGSFLSTLGRIEHGFNSRPDLNKSIDISDTFESADPVMKSRRREMKGPDNIDGLLSGLKQKASENIVIDRNDDDNLSTVSITELKDMKENATMPRKKGRKKSDKNTISLDI